MFFITTFCLFVFTAEPDRPNQVREIPKERRGGSSSVPLSKKRRPRIALHSSSFRHCPSHTPPSSLHLVTPLPPGSRSIVTFPRDRRRRARLLPQGKGDKGRCSVPFLVDVLFTPPPPSSPCSVPSPLTYFPYYPLPSPLNSFIFMCALMS